MRRPRRRRARAFATTALLAGSLAVAVAVAVAAVWTGAPATAVAQSPATPAGGAAEGATGAVLARLVSGTAGARVADGVAVELITLGGTGELQVQRAEANGGRAEFAAAADPALTHLLRVIYAGVQYFGDPVLLSTELPSAEVEVRVYETTTEPPPITVTSTVVTVIALDREAAELTIVREDLVENGTDRVYVSARAGGATLRLPLPEGTRDASALSEEGSFVLGGGTLDVDLPLRPGVTSVVTRYTVGYDRARDGYRLRVTAPLPTERVEVRVPARFVRELRALDGAERAPDAELEGERLLVAASAAEAREGQGTLVELRGLAGITASNPLTDGRGPLLATALALVLLSAAVWGLARAGRRQVPTP